MRGLLVRERERVKGDWGVKEVGKMNRGWR